MSANEEDLDGIQVKVSSSILQKMNVSCTLPTVIQHGPPELGRLELYDLQTEWGMIIKVLCDAVFSNSAAGQMIMLNLQYLQLEAGVGNRLLEEPSLELPYFTPSWLVSLRVFCPNTIRQLHSQISPH